MLIREDDLRGPEIAALLEAHLENARRWSPPESIHALDLDKLRTSDITFWTLWDQDELIGCGALRELSPDSGEIKSMHTAEEHRGRGAGKAVLRHIIAEARKRGYRTLCLETGTPEGFRSAREMYRKAGFVECAPFDNYRPDPYSVYMRLGLRAE
jgi:putative acetyltransferase